MISGPCCVCHAVREANPGAAAEIDDHLNRGRNMDTRTPASHCRFVT